MLAAETAGSDATATPLVVEVDDEVPFIDLLHRHDTALQAALAPPASKKPTALDNAAAPRLLIGCLPAESSDPDAEEAIATSLDDTIELSVMLDQRPQTPGLVIFYDAVLFRQDVIAGFGDALRTIITEAPTQERQPARLLVQPSAHQQRLVATVNATAHEFQDDHSLLQRIEARRTAMPDAIALVHGDGERLSWRALETLSGTIADALSAAGVRRGDVVGVMTSRSVAAVAGILGILRAGAAYLPLDRNYPIERLGYIIENAAVPLVLVDDPDVALPVKTLRFDTLLDRWRSGGGAGRVTPPIPTSGLDLANLIYTSGSTGQPKGVLLDQLGRINNFEDFNRRFSIGPEDSVLAVSSLSFDMSAYDFLGSLMAGSRIVLVPDTLTPKPKEWLDLMHANSVSIWHSVPTLLVALMDEIEDHSADLAIPRTLRLILLGGDWIPVDLVRRVRSVWPDVTVISLGGATELSMDSLIYEIGEVGPGWKSIPYGHPMANQTAYVLDRRSELAVTGIAGELFLGGRGTAWGYWRLPGLTASKFVPDPYAARPGSRLYATGDLARFMPDGEIELLGRMDFQVKIRGLRIELGEIETVICDHPAVRDAVVLAVPGNDGSKYLEAWIVPADDAPDGPVDLRPTLARRLPDAMIPSVFTIVDALPLSANGKVDRRKLLNDSTRDRPDSDHPTDRLEEIVCNFFADALKLDSVGRNDNFFQLGGYSLLAFRLIGNLEEVFKVTVPLRLVFEAPTPSAFAAALLAEGLLERVRLTEVLAAWDEVHAETI